MQKYLDLHLMLTLYKLITKLHSPNQSLVQAKFKMMKEYLINLN